VSGRRTQRLQTTACEVELVARLTALAAVVGLISSACSPDPAMKQGTPNFEAVFEELDRIELEEPPKTPIVGITSVNRRPGGGFIVADELGDRVYLFDLDGRIQRALGGSGSGPGELDAPTAAVERADGHVFATQRANRRLTEYTPSGDAIALTVPGRYGAWLLDLGDGLVAGVGSPADRFVVMTYGGDSLSSFGALDPEVNERPFWIYYARESATLLGDLIAINTSFYPTVRLFNLSGDSVDMIGRAPSGWVQAGDPPVDRARTPQDQASVREWSSGFSIVSGLAGLDDGRLVVQYSRFAPSTRDLYRTEPFAIDVYDREGTVLAEQVPLDAPIFCGGADLVLLVAEPPEPWTLARYRWRGG